MRFYIAIEEGSDETAWGVVVPDLPGCYSAGDTLDEALSHAVEAIELHCETVIEAGEGLTEASTLQQLRATHPDLAGWIWALVDVPVEKYLGPAEKINITVPKVTLAQIDRFVRQHGENRSGFLVRAARALMKIAS